MHIIESRQHKGVADRLATDIPRYSVSSIWNEAIFVSEDSDETCLLERMSVGQRCCSFLIQFYSDTAANRHSAILREYEIIFIWRALTLNT